MSMSAMIRKQAEAACLIGEAVRQHARVAGTCICYIDPSIGPGTGSERRGRAISDSRSLIPDHRWVSRGIAGKLQAERRTSRLEKRRRPYRSPFCRMAAAGLMPDVTRLRWLWPQRASSLLLSATPATPMVTRARRWCFGAGPHKLRRLLDHMLNG